MTVSVSNFVRSIRATIVRDNLTGSDIPALIKAGHKAKSATTEGIKYAQAYLLAVDAGMDKKEFGEIVKTQKDSPSSGWGTIRTAIANCVNAARDPKTGGKQFSEVLVPASKKGNFLQFFGELSDPVGGGRGAKKKESDFSDLLELSEETTIEESNRIRDEILGDGAAVEVARSSSELPVE